MKTTELIDFEIKENHVESNGSNFYFLRINPPNLSIMTDGEKAAAIQSFQLFYNAGDWEFQLMSLDKTENLSGNQAFWGGLLREGEEDPCKEIKTSIIAQIKSIESSSSSVGRAFYFVLRIKEISELTRFEDALNSKGILCNRTDKQELITVLRNFNLREFLSFDLYDFEKEMEAAYESTGTKTKRSR
jgi:hypothetical protein